MAGEKGSTTSLSDEWVVRRYQNNGAPDRVSIGASIKLSRDFNSMGFEASHHTDVRPDETPDQAIARIEGPLEDRMKEFGSKVKALFGSIIGR